MIQFVRSPPTHDVYGATIHRPHLRLLAPSRAEVDETGTIAHSSTDVCPPAGPLLSRRLHRVSRNHLAQLYAYCLLVEEHYGIRPPYGVVRYLDRATLAVLREERLAYPAGTEEHLRALVDELVTKKQVGRTASGPIEPDRLCRRCRADARCGGAA
jgi:hypothetical protein